MRAIRSIEWKLGNSYHRGEYPLFIPFPKDDSSTYTRELNIYNYHLFFAYTNSVEKKLRHFKNIYFQSIF
jgi:hypothetical protein